MTFGGVDIVEAVSWAIHSLGRDSPQSTCSGYNMRRDFYCFELGIAPNP